MKRECNKLADASSITSDLAPNLYGNNFFKAIMSFLVLSSKDLSFLKDLTIESCVLD
jgi:hypothetical protein